VSVVVAWVAQLVEARDLESSLGHNESLFFLKIVLQDI